MADCFAPTSMPAAAQPRASHPARRARGGDPYADPGPLTIGAVRWPEWTADRPLPATRVPRYRPIATVVAAAEAPETAFESCRRRLDELAEMLYAQAPDRERNDNAEVQRPRPERFRARREAR